ncbi:uncharacterized protein LOC125653386 [Ostrea edulis]|uniref:uncharacterized protein LOC125653386 n=1 Tax=Ostrea edulis TaxID=37623 RepID=UPI0024AFC565|nr:uncharacterized protein LOC125653386 [Ostrea edulis]
MWKLLSYLSVPGACHGNDLCFIKGRCVPETRQSSEPYSPWILVENSGHIFSAECTCVAGNGSCKHVVALLFGIIDHVISMEDRSTIGVTDTAAYWDKPRKVCRPIAVNDLDIRFDMNLPDKARPSVDSGYLPLKSATLDQRAIEKGIMKVLKQSQTAAVALYTLSDSDSESDVSMLVEDTPLNIIELLAKHGQENLSIEDSYINQVRELTWGQSNNLMWHYQRKCRLTASNFYSAFHYRGNSTENYIVKSILGKYQFTSKSVEYGKSQEPVARGKYIEYMSSRHPSFQCSETGIFVYKDFPYLAASPDGVTECKCCGKGLLEIKCPFSFQNEISQVAMSKNSSCISAHGKYELKKKLSSPYYVQMLGQMAIGNFSFCDFVLYTKKDIHVERVHYSSADWELLSDKLKSFYTCFVLPNLV